MAGGYERAFLARIRVGTEFRARTRRAADNVHMRVAAGILAVLAVACLVVAIADMARGADEGRRSWVLRGAAVALFAAAVLLNVLAH
jgi:hypothetical protein